MIAIASDHGAYLQKEALKKHLLSQGYELEDFGTYSEESCDYPIFAAKAARAVADGTCDRGIVLCTTGIGASIAANKVRGIRCALCSDPLSAALTRAHNDSNMLALAGGIIGEKLMLHITDIWLKTPFEGGRHQRRIDQIGEIENH